MHIEEKLTKILKFENHEIMLIDKGIMHECGINPVSFYVQIHYINLNDYENEYNYLLLDCTYKDGNVYVQTGEFGKQFTNVSVDKDVLNELVRKLLNQRFILYGLEHWYNVELHELEENDEEQCKASMERFKEMIELIKIESDKIQLDPKEIKQLNSIRLKRVTGVEE